MREDAFQDWVLDLMAEVMPRTGAWHADLRTLGDLRDWGWRVRLATTPDAVWRRIAGDLLARGAPRALVRPETELDDLLD